MKPLIFAALLALVSPLVARADEPAIQGTIESQIEAFKVDDFAGAFRFASPNIQRLFQTPDNFGLMVRQGFPMVWRPGRVQFLELREKRGQLWQKIMIEDAQGVFHVLDYQMIEGPDGWRINGVEFLGAPQLGV